MNEITIEEMLGEIPYVHPVIVETTAPQNIGDLEEIYKELGFAAFLDYLHDHGYYAQNISFSFDSNELFSESVII
jgi:hypothetical protein